MTVTDLYDDDIHEDDGDRALAVQGYDLTVEYAASHLSFLNKPGFKTAIPVTGNIKGDGTFLDLYCFPGFAVSAVGAGTTLLFGMTKVISQFPFKGFLYQALAHAHDDGIDFFRLDTFDISPVDDVIDAITRGWEITRN